jgi:branched-chain amino acid aminotransferase
MKVQPHPIWMDGQMQSGDAACVHILSPSLHYGWGVYEGIRFYQTQDGPAAFRLTDHLKRLYQSALGLSMTIPYTLGAVDVLHR